MNKPSATGFSNLASLDKLYFSLIAERKLTVQNSDEIASPVGTLSPLASTPTVIVQVKKAVSKSIVHVEILNGCGIKGAADWVVSRISSQTILAKNGGNAVNFNYANSQLLFAAAAFLDLEKALTTLGFSKLNKTGSSILPAGHDEIFIVGKYFQMIKGN